MNHSSQVPHISPLTPDHLPPYSLSPPLIPRQTQHQVRIYQLVPFRPFSYRLAVHILLGIGRVRYRGVTYGGRLFSRRVASVRLGRGRLECQ